MTKVETATFAGGCFWCMMGPFEIHQGVFDVRSGYTGGHVVNPTYKQVCNEDTGHYEAVQMTYDPSIVSYGELLDIFWRQIDPTDDGGQFADRGDSYRTAIFYHNEAQRELAEASKEALAASGRFDKPIATAILPASTFYTAEDYHQDYHRKHKFRYKMYRHGSGRDAFLDEHWKKDKNIDELKKKLTPTQFHITQNNGTEPPFQNEFWNHKAEGIYVDIVSGEPLFSSFDKFDSGCGWPSFTKPLEDRQVVEKLDLSHGMFRTEVRSLDGDSHLGHVFDDGPQDRGGLRYCINSAALRFIAKADLEREGYGQYLKLWD